MKYLLLIIPLFLFSCRNDDSLERFQKECPYELHYDGHFLRIPITISPHQMNYRVGDTIRFSTIFSDSIEDIGTQQTFKIENFPFKPLCLLYRFYDDLKWDAGFRVNQLVVDSSYQAVYNYSSSYADGFRAATIYDDTGYHFEYQVILKQPGRYILIMDDLYQEHSGGGNADLNAEADAITFEGKCPTLQYYLCSMIEGEDHLEQFMRELKHLDNNVYRGKLSHINYSAADDPLGSGPLRVEWSGFYAFEVEE